MLRMDEVTLIWRRWVVANVIGELVGFGIAGVLMILAGDIIAPLAGPVRILAAVGAVLVLGVVEGAAVGAAQWSVLRGYIPSLTGAAWLSATIAGAVIAWGCGMVMGTVAADAAVASATDASYAGALVIGAVAGGILATPQWMVLRATGTPARWWVPAHALAWSIGMVVAFAGVAVLPPAPDLPALAATIALTGLAMGAAVAAITAFAVVAAVRPGAMPARSPARP